MADSAAAASAGSALASPSGIASALSSVLGSAASPSSPSASIAGGEVISLVVQGSVPSTVGKCHLLVGSFALVVQGCLGCIAFSSLLLKRHLEHPKRSWKVWALDILKQMISAVAAHATGMTIALLASHADSAATSSDRNECGWYFVTYLTDASLGTALAFVMLKRLQSWARSRGYTSLQSSGNYGRPIRYRFWAAQALSWCLIAVFARILCGCVIIGQRQFYSVMTTAVTRPFEGNPQGLLLFVMVACPAFVSVIQAWIQDAFLKGRQRSSPSLESKPSKAPKEEGPGTSADVES